MEQTRKNLKTTSVIVLALAGLSLLNILFELFFGALNSELNGATVPDGAPDNVAMIARIFILVLSFLLLLPQAYIGIKGIRIAKNPDRSRGHIIWGTIVLVFTALELLTPLLALLQGGGEAFGNTADFLSIAVDVFILYEYVKYAKALREEI